MFTILKRFVCAQNASTNFVHNRTGEKKTRFNRGDIRGFPFPIRKRGGY